MGDLHLVIQRKPSQKETVHEQERDRLRSLVVLVKDLFAIVESGSKTPEEDCREAQKLIRQFADVQHPQLGWLADSIEVPLHVMRKWEIVPYQKLLRVLDRLIVAIECQADSEERARAHAEWVEEHGFR